MRCFRMARIIGLTMTQRKPKSFTLPSGSELLGGRSPATFLAEYWQKKPLLVRQAVPGLDSLLDRQGLIDLACREEAESRLVRPMRGNWSLSHGPFEAETLARLPKRNWSLLVQGVNLMLAEADALLNRFNFIPYARLDDLMVSFAPPGGGVGPHFDSYDVFLIQGLGRRRWEISAQDDLELVDDCPLRILKRFRVDQSWELEPGDMLYLPPKYAHNGVALSDCMTWSVGFRAPSAQELAIGLLDFLRDHLIVDGHYADPDLGLSHHPGAIPARMRQRLKAMLKAVRWDDALLDEFIGRHLSEPKPSVFFDPPTRDPGLARFRAQARRRGVRLDARSRLLYLGTRVFLNGEPVDPVDSAALRALRTLADRRSLAGAAIPEAMMPDLHAWSLAGYLHLGEM